MRTASLAPQFPKHFDGKRFFNPDGQRAHGFVDVLRWKLTSRAQHSPGFVDDVVPSNRRLAPEVERRAGKVNVVAKKGYYR